MGQLGNESSDSLYVPEVPTHTNVATVQYNTSRLHANVMFIVIFRRLHHIFHLVVV